MALIGSLNTGVTAMKSFVKGMEVIGNNIANVNTIGYKAQRTNYSDNFADTLRNAMPASETRSNLAPQQVGSGVGIGSTQKLFNQGAINQTGVSSDLAISGNGFFRVYDQSNDTHYVTRNGTFRVNSEGYLTDQNGNYVLGLTGGSEFSGPDTIGKIKIDLNSAVKLDANNRPIDNFMRLVLNDGSRAAQSTDSSTGYYRTNNAGNLIDSEQRIILENDLRVTANADGTYTRVDTSNRLVDSAGLIILNGDQRAISDGAGGYLLADSSGTAILTDPLDPLSTTAWDPLAPVPPLATTSTAAAWNSNSPTPNLATTSADAEWDPNNLGTLPDVALPDPADPNQVALSIQSWAVDTYGNLNLFLNDGSSYVRGKILLQQFNDPDALSLAGNGLYTSLGNAGPNGMQSWVIGSKPTDEALLFHQPNERGVGFIQARALEGANVDLTEEFANMISTQRSFQAGSRMISISDEMLQEIVNLKR